MVKRVFFIAIILCLVVQNDILGVESGENNSSPACSLGDVDTLVAAFCSAQQEISPLDVPVGSHLSTAVQLHTDSQNPFTMDHSVVDEAANSNCPDPLEQFLAEFSKSNPTLGQEAPSAEQAAAAAAAKVRASIQRAAQEQKRQERERAEKEKEQQEIQSTMQELHIKWCKAAAQLTSSFIAFYVYARANGFPPGYVGAVTTPTTIALHSVIRSFMPDSDDGLKSQENPVAFQTMAGPAVVAPAKRPARTGKQMPAKQDQSKKPRLTHGKEGEDDYEYEEENDDEDIDSVEQRAQ